MRQPFVLLPALVALGLALAPGKARADAWPTFAGVRPFDLNFYSQVQAGAAGVLASGPKPGGMELRAALNVGGIGASAGGRYEPYPSGGGLLGFLDVELRPLPLADVNLFRTLDPYVCAGGELGGGSRGFRASQTLGLGLDVGLFAHPERSRSSVHPALTLRYQLRTVQTPADLPRSLLHVGGAFRTTF